MNSYKKLFIGAFIIFLALLSAGAVLAWTGPLSSPPNCTSGNPGCDAPLNVANSAQTKAGGSITVSGGGAMGATSFCLPGSNPTGGCITVWPSAGASQWTTSGSNIYYSTGHVGIGTGGSPANLFEINGNSMNGASNANLGVTFPDGVDVDVFGAQNNNNSQNGISLGLGTNNASTSIYLQRITQNVGVGTTNPAARLDVEGGNTYTSGDIVADYNTGYDTALNNGVITTARSDGMYLQYNEPAPIYFYNNLNSIAVINGTGLTVNDPVTATAYYYSSDERLKQNIASIATSTALQDILALNPVTFNWKDPSRGAGTQIGFIAQQVQQVVPALVETDASTTLEAVDYARVTPLLVGAAQAQEQKIDALQSQIQTQQQEIDQLTAEVKLLEVR